ncbi:MAG: hypothetical protein CL916_03070 [Deltaproteobacteria bacterium]|nr:hypothetical protein [Deltaproteobacteria bacterium]
MVLRIKNAVIFVRSTIKNVDFAGSDLRESSLNHAAIQNSIYDEKTIWPEGFHPNNYDLHMHLSICNET